MVDWNNLTQLISIDVGCMQTSHRFPNPPEKMLFYNTVPAYASLTPQLLLGLSLVSDRLKSSYP